MEVPETCLPPVSELVRRPAAAPLRPYVAGYSGYRLCGTPPGTHRGLPSPYLTLILTLDEPLVIAAHPDPRQPGGRYDTLLGGLHTTPAMISHPGRQSGIQVALHPLGARALLGRPAGEVAALDVELTAVLGPVALLLRERLLACAGWDERFAVLDDVLLRRARAANGADGPASGGVPREAARAWQVLAATGGRTGVADLAGGVGWSQRRLLQVFRREVGLTPKEAGRVVRFHRARRLLFGAAGAGQPVSLAGLAARAGYYDQAHLAREFRALAGCSPSVLLAEEFRFVQATPADDDAGW